MHSNSIELLKKMQELENALKNISREEAVRLLRRKFGERGVRALQKVLSRSVAKCCFKPSNLEIWIVRGRSGKEHLVLPKFFCDCEDFYLNVVIRRKVEACHHIIAQVIAESYKLYEEIEERDLKLVKILMERMRTL